ncbi:septum formation initiator family protein [Reinekea blandensis]|uniref:Cell division protein FtsB n=1 Tax=Reinekea blandensis MED297 TaxID=314283 RepID=A4BCH8_9GAMM|nr:septum formation initiator family protein [Reinekea blandensis]EAR10244.1 cell division protein FtsB [Reinekea sp. MED297] [Reinekea blandensis MED297]
MRLVQIALLILIVLLQYRFWFAENGYLDHRRLLDSVAEEQSRLAAQQRINANLQARVDDLKSGNDAIEELARQNLGLIKPGETFVLIADE